MTVRTSKCLFTLPVALIDELHQLLGHGKGQGLAHLLAEPGKRFSRDRFLSQLLANELGQLARGQGFTPNSAEARRVLLERRVHTQAESSYRQLNLTLPHALADELKSACETARIPRDLFMQAFLKLVVGGLREAVQAARDPTAGEWGRRVLLGYGHPYQSLTVTADEIEEHDTVHAVVDALARLKSVTFGQAWIAYWKRPAPERKRLRQSAEVRRLMAQIAQKAPRSELSLDEFLPATEQRKLRMQRAATRRRDARRKRA